MTETIETSNIPLSEQMDQTSDKVLGTANDMGKIALTIEIKSEEEQTLKDVLLNPYDIPQEPWNRIGAHTLQEVADHDPRAAYTLVGYKIMSELKQQPGKLPTFLPNPDVRPVDLRLVTKRKHGLWHLAPGRLGLREEVLANISVGPGDHANMQARVNEAKKNQDS